MASPITKDTFAQLLPSLGFTKQGILWTKDFGPARLAVDLRNETLVYPEDQGLVVNERQTCNFSQPENFVVFECVDRLLEKGYAARHIELEPKWKLGHGASGGRADVLIRDNEGRALLIIECKTAGREFDKAWRATLQDGDQLFGYVEQERSTQFLALYASEFKDGSVHYRSHVIAHRDNAKYLADNPLFKSFASAEDRKQRFAVWRDTYKLDFRTAGIFETAIQPYHIGKDKYSLADLHPISADDQQKKYHEFATILRQHNVSGRENAFDKLVNLFLCKLVDETEHPDELKFYWKGVAYDTHFELLDRLQQLYQAGMGKFLGEDITYIAESDVSAALRFVRHNPDATQRAVWNLFIQQKFFTNNDFSLIDVHNERLFYQNAEVLLKILQMWQDIRLTGGTTHNQFLGDMFEGFLDQGIKQSEGQYFTPIPICRFMLMSLPLETLVKANAGAPKAIDYACGAGHFLTELALQMKPLVALHHPKKEMRDYHAAIVGIEKEYRLSKIAKVSAFMYGQPEIKICYGDALVSTHEAFPEIRDGTFDLLVANPPFSVKGFLETLPESERSAYRLTETIKDLDTANSIEPFFVERAKQLLKPGGIAAIILPSSILSNGGTTYVRAREILLQSFDIVAIAEFGGGTFGKTGTNTVILFLRRKATAPDSAEHYRERVAGWFRGVENDKRKQVVYKDAHLIDRYSAHRGIAVEDYKTLLCGSPNAVLLAHETFVAYRVAFDKSTETKGLVIKKWFRDLKPEEQTAELAKRFLAFATIIERDKLLHFILADQQPNSVLIVKSPSDTKERRRFLGYEWSDSKGDEGIKLITDAQGRHLTPLYDEANRGNPAKINYVIAQNFTGSFATVPTELGANLILVPLTDLLDFARVNFDKQIAVVATKAVKVESKWPTERLATLADVIAGQSPESEYYNTEGKGLPFYQGRKDFGEFQLRPPTVWTTNTTKVSLKSDVLMSVRAPVGDVNLNPFERICIGRGLAAIRAGIRVLPKFLFEFINQNQPLFRGNQGAAFEAISTADLSEKVIPVPPLDVQQKIVTECDAVDVEAEGAQGEIEKSRKMKDQAINEAFASSAPRADIASLSLSVQYGLSEKMNEGGVGYKIFRMNEIAEGRAVDDGSMKYANISAKEFAKYRLSRGDILFNRVNGSEDHVGKTGVFELEGEYCFASYLVRVVPDTKKVLPRFLTSLMNASAFRDELKRKAVRSAGQININAEKMKNMRVPVPPLSEQKRFVAKIEALEIKIATARAILAAVPARKEAILKKYL